MALKIRTRAEDKPGGREPFIKKKRGERDVLLLRVKFIENYFFFR
jgi:hypothetical protein